MKGLAVLLFVVHAVFAQVADASEAFSPRSSVVGVDECPREQEIDWTIEYLMRHENCHMFWQCTHGQPIERICYGELYFNLATWQCDWPHNVDCTDRIIPTTSTTQAATSTTTTTTPAPTTTTTTTTTPAPTTTTTTPAPTTTTTTTTPAPTTTTTTTTPAPTTTTTTTTTTPRPTPAPTTTSTQSSSSTVGDIQFLPNGCPVDPHIHWLLPHEYDCNLFYYCVWGRLVLRQCPEELHFNTVLQVCDWTADAGCTLPGPSK